jgi:hypothetical protein
MDPLHLNKTSSQGGTMDCVFRAWQHHSNFKKTIVGLFSLFHLGNCVFTIDVTQTSPLTVKFDACLVLPCGDPRDISSRLRLYICAHTLVPERTFMMILIKTQMGHLGAGQMWGGLYTI